MANETTTTELAAVIQTWIERTAFPLTAYNIVFDTYARLVPLPSGNTVRVPLLEAHAVIKGNLVEIGTNVSAAQLIPQYVEKDIEFFGAYTDLTKKGVHSSLLDSLKFARGQLEQQAARSVNRRFARAISSQLGMRWRRVANGTNNTLFGRSLSGSDAGVTGINLADGTVHANMVGGQVFFLTGKNAGQGRRITAIVTTASIISFASTGTFSQPGLPQAPAAGDTVDVVGTNAVSGTTTYDMTLTEIFLMAELARRNGAQGFTPGGRVREDGFGIMRNVAGTVPQLAVFVDTQIALDIQADAATNGYTDVFKQTGGGLSRWSKGQFGLVNNVSFIGHNEGWRMDAAAGATTGGIENDAGTVHTPTLVGMNSYLATKFRGVGNSRDGLAFRVKQPGRQTFSVNHEAILYRIEWDAWLGVLTQNGLHGNTMLAGANRAT